MTSDAFSPTPAQPSSPRTLKLIIPGRLPLWNAILALHHWQRAKFKKVEQEKFMSALRASAADSLTQTASARSMLSIAAATLDSYLTTRRQTSLSKPRNAKPRKAKKNTPK